MRRALFFCSLLLIMLLTAVPALAETPPLADQVRGLSQHASEGAEAADANRPELMRAEYEELHAIWGGFEDGVRAQDPEGYINIETALDAVKDAVAAQPLDPAAVKAAYTHLGTELNEVGARLASAPGTPATAPATAAAEITPATLLVTLGEVEDALARGDIASARSEFTGFIRSWPAAEDAIATRSDDDYKAIESSLGQASAALRAEPADTAAASTALASIRSTLTPYTVDSSYSALDAALIILREGLEALLVVVALLAFLRKSGNSDKRGWIWAGAGLGVLASIGAALALQAIFSTVSAGRNRELIEGITGLVAAALLFYVSYWLHSKASLGAWKKYIDARTTQALARGSMLGLALLAFLAVFREGAETAVFYLGMAPSISMRDLLLGFGAGAAVLAVLAVLMLVVGVKLPLRPFFRVAGLLVYYLGFKFVGTGLHALQVADVLPTSPIGSGDSNAVLEFFGIYLTWQTLLPQLLLLAAALAVFFYLRAQERRARGVGTPAVA
jgi:high-affinity iron transporter